MINVEFTTVITAISRLSITGYDGRPIPVKDVDSIPVSGMQICPLIIPKWDGFVKMKTPVHSSFGTNGNEQLIIPYILTYRYLHCPMTEGVGGLMSVYNGLVQNARIISQKFLRDDDLVAGAPIVHIDSIINMGPVKDSAGNDYYGCDFLIEVQEFYPQVSAKSAVILVDDIYGTPRDISNDVSAYEILYDVNKVEVTTHDDQGANSIGVESVNGLALTVLWNPTATTGAFTILSAIVNSKTSKTVSIKPDPLGKTFSGEFFCTGIHPIGKSDQAPIQLGRVEFETMGSIMPTWA